MKLFIVRHGETDYNLNARMQGHLDVPLNVKGEEQAAHLGTVLNKSGVRFDKIFSSDLKRASRTAEIIVGKQQPINLVSDLRERQLGELQGLLYSEASQKMRAENKSSFAEYGEKPEDHLARVARAWCHVNESISEHDNNVLVVSHGGTLRTLFQWLVYSGKVTVDEPQKRLSQKLGNCCVTIIENGEFSVFAKQFTDTLDVANDLL